MAQQQIHHLLVAPARSDREKIVLAVAGSHEVRVVGEQPVDGGAVAGEHSVHDLTPALPMIHLGEYSLTNGELRARLEAGGVDGGRQGKSSQAC